VLRIRLEIGLGPTPEMADVHDCIFRGQGQVFGQYIPGGKCPIFLFSSLAVARTSRVDKHC